MCKDILKSTDTSEKELESIPHSVLMKEMHINRTTRVNNKRAFKGKKMSALGISTVPFLFLSLVVWMAIGQEVIARDDPFQTVSKEYDRSSKRLEAISTLLEPMVIDNSVELCLNSRNSQHILNGTVGPQQLSNVLWAAGKAPIIGAYRDIYVTTSDGTYLYNPDSHTLSLQSGDVAHGAAFIISYKRELVFDAGVSYMPAILASVSFGKSTETPLACCPKGVALCFGSQEVSAVTDELVAHSSVPEGELGWLPDPRTVGENSLEDVLRNLKYVGSFAHKNLSLLQISQILWAGYGCTPHTTYNGRAGLTVPSAYANYYLTGTIYLVKEDGVYRYHNRNPSQDLTTSDHRIEPVSFGAVRDGLQSVVSGLSYAPCYVILCLNSSHGTFEYALLEVGFVASNMLIQASALGLGCHFVTKLTATEQRGIQAVTSVPESHIPQAIVGIGYINTVNFQKYAAFADHWLKRACDDSNDWCGGADLNRDHSVDIYDLAELADNWLRLQPTDWLSK